MGYFKKLVLENEKPIIVDFFASWCPPCKKYPALFEKALENGSGNFEIIKIDVDQNEQLSKEYNISSIPVLHLFNKGEIKQTLTGYSEQKFSDLVEKAEELAK